MPENRHNFAASKGTKDIPQTGKREKEIINNKLKKEIEYEKANDYFIGLFANDASGTKC